jgi:proline iminopeptidase
MTQTLGRLFVALISFPVGVAVGFVGWIAALFALTFATSHVSLLFGLSLATAFGLATALPWLVTVSTGTFSRCRPILAGLGGVATLTLLRIDCMPGLLSPLVPRAELQRAAKPPKSVRYWRLPTGSRIAYYRQPAVGPRVSTPVIYLHGGPGLGFGTDMGCGDSLIAALGFDQYWYDQVGAGLSGRLRDITGYTMERHVADLEAIRRQIGAARIILIGTSWGGTLAANYMAVHPDRVAKAILDSPGEIDPSEWMGEIAEMRDESAESPEEGSAGRKVETERAVIESPGDPASEARPAGDNPWWEDVPVPEERRARVEKLESNFRYVVTVAVAHWNPSLAHNLLPDREADAYWSRILEATYDEEYPPAGICGFWSHAMTHADSLIPGRRTRAALKRNRTPTLILRGEGDFIPWEIAYQYRATLPNATLLCIPGAEHDVCGTAPDAFFEVVTAFLTGERLPLQPYTGRTPPR